MRYAYGRLLDEADACTRASLQDAFERAKGNVRALRISPEVFLQLASGRPDRALHVMRQLSTHIANDLRRLAALKEELQKAVAAARAG